MKKLILIIPYYGRWPKYFGFYLQSLRGRCFELLLVTDLPTEGLDLPPNVRVVKMSLADLARRMEQTLGERIVLESPMRLCDFKPMYGKIFAGEIAGYDYWAFGDCDLVYGRALDGYLERKFAEDFDALSLHPIWPTGSFFVLRNSEKMNGFFERCANWREVCTLPNTMYVNFDEIGGNYYQAVREGKMTLQDCAKKRDCFGAALDRAGDIKYLREDAHSETWLAGETLEMCDGRLMLNGREIRLFHFVLPKARRFFKFADFAPGATHYLVTDTGFYVGAFARRFHKLIGLKRKLVAAIHSLAVNGFKRLGK